MNDIAKMYGSARKVALWAEREGIVVDETLNQAVGDEIDHRKRMTAIAYMDQDTANTIMTMVNEIAPDFAQNVAYFSNELVDEARRQITDDVTASDLQALAKAVQTATDITGNTQRHSVGAQITASNIKVEGFSFLLDSPPEVEENAIDAEVDE